MTNTAASGTFPRPHCGGLLEPEKGVKTMSCKYCNALVTIPKELRTRPISEAAPAGPTVPAFGKGCIRAAVLVAVIGVLILAALGIGGYVWLRNATRDIPGVSSITSGFAVKSMTFGTQGIEPGMFEDACSVAVDGQGDILVGDYQDGRVQTFSPSGKYLSYFTAGSEVDALAVGPDGNVTVAHDGKLSVYDPSGKELGTIEGADGTASLTFGADGSLYVLTRDDRVIRYDPGGTVTLTIANAFQSVLGSGESDPHIAVDGRGNIYVVGPDSDTVLKYSPAGQYMDKFGGRAESTGPAIPGTLFNASGIGVDGYGRVFVSDWNTDVEVFDSSGTPLQAIDALTLGFTTNPFGMALDTHGPLYLADGESVMVLKIKAPSQ